MGLDMWLLGIKGKGESAESVRIAYYRNHHDLHGWMENLWMQKTGKEDVFDFNCVYLRLSQKDLNRLKRDIKKKKLTKPIYPFPATNPPDDYLNKRDLNNIYTAHALIKEGYKVFYYSWW